MCVEGGICVFGGRDIDMCVCVHVCVCVIT